MPKATSAELNPQPLSTTKQFARHLQVTTRGVQNLRDRGEIPFIQFNARLIRYRISEVEKFLNSKAR